MADGATGNDSGESVPKDVRELVGKFREAASAVLDLEPPVPLETMSNITDAYGDFFLFLVRLNFGALGAVGTVLTVLEATQIESQLFDASIPIGIMVVCALICLASRQGLLYSSSLALVKGSHDPQTFETRNAERKIDDFEEALEREAAKRQQENSRSPSSPNESPGDSLSYLVELNVISLEPLEGEKLGAVDVARNIPRPEVLAAVASYGAVEQAEGELKKLESKAEEKIASLEETLRNVPDLLREALEEEGRTLSWATEHIENLQRFALLGIAVTVVNFLSAALAIYMLLV